MLVGAGLSYVDVDRIDVRQRGGWALAGRGAVSFSFALALIGVGL